MLKKLKKAVTNPRVVLIVLLEKCARLFPDKLYISMKYRLLMRKPMNWKNPQTFNEKLQWLKLYDRKPEYTQMVDKYEAKKFVANIIGEEYIIPTLGVWDRFEDIDFDALPEKFVLKTTHDSGTVAICTDKQHFDIAATRKLFNKRLRRKYYYSHREWPYKNVKPRIIAEKYMVDESGWELKDYKVFVMNGSAPFVEVDYNRYVFHKLNVYDRDWQFIDFYMTSPNDKNVQIPKPQKLNLMLTLAEKIAHQAKARFLRVDFYSIGEQLYVGELTFTPGSGCIAFYPQEYDKIVGSMLDIKK